MTEVAGVADDFYIFVLSSDGLELAQRVIPRGVVNKDVYVSVVTSRNERGPHQLVEFADVGLFVVARRDDGQCLSHLRLPSRLPWRLYGFKLWPSRFRPRLAAIQS